MANTHGICYLIGAGPGDPGLITRRGAECLSKAEVLYYDQLVAPALLTEVPECCRRVYVGKRAGDHAVPQAEIDQLLCQDVRSGRIVVRLKGGDPFVFGRGGEEALALAAAGLPFEIIPGITSGIAGPAYAGIPVTHRGIATSVTLVTGHESPEKEAGSIDWDALSTIDGTVCFYMGLGTLPLITERLIQGGRRPQTPVAIIEAATLERQRTLTGTLSDIVEKVKAEDLHSPAMIVIGDVVSLRDSLRWFDRRPLFGRRILVTRSRAQASLQSRELRSRGAQVMEFPAIEIIPLPVTLHPDLLSTMNRRVPVEEAALRHSDPLSGALAQISCSSGRDWVIFTSVNGVEEAWKRVRAVGRDARIFSGCRLAVVGESTAAALRSHGLYPDLVSEVFSGKALAVSLLEDQGIALRGQICWLLRGDLADPALRATLEGAGASVHEVTAYHTRPAADLDFTVLEGKIDAITFTSSSTVINFSRLLGERLPRLINDTDRPRLVSIGPVTSEALRTAGLPVDAEAEEHTIRGITTVLETLFHNSAEFNS